ncbi:glycosyl hydrolase family 8 [Marinisporobacter balticus]|uniref:Glycosyl hydrolase family 8 n=1 Tax=Marinisporobacter balticus TaxID=2018667 RepID=A0A4R2KHA1_9FIRM|nr:glycosyl hydrolase family 8 [Marinisporobacter balticus]TCO69368.1 glycosyl hydrolase family 8 [Marinisporobacter balticus]
MIKKQWLIFIVLVFIFTIIYAIGSQITLSLKPKNYSVSIENIPAREKKALEFITQRISGTELSVYTNYINRKSNEEVVATGKDILSESQGLLLLYLLNRDKKEYFDVCLDWTVNNLYLDNGIFAWMKTKSSQIKNTNALIDDLRIVRALILANKKWENKKYLKYIQKSSKALLTYNVKDNMHLDFYDNGFKSKSNIITISYLDLYTMKELTNVDFKWNKVYENSYELVKNSKIKGTGLYKFQYNLDQHIYTTSNEISLIQSIYTMVHLAEIGEYDIEGINWIWDEYEKYGKIFATYSYETYEPMSDIESTALYALIARLFYLKGEYHKAERILNECEKFQVMNSNSEIYGGFGNEYNKEIYSFDNLQYILSSSIIHKKN